METKGTRENRIEIKLESLIEKTGISKNKLCHKAEIQFSQIQAWEKNEISRMDLNVLTRICDVFADLIPNFEIQDLIEYKKEEK